MTPIEKVRALRRLADSTTFEPEAESARAKALELMAAHHITEEMLIAVPRPVRRRPAPQPAPTPTVVTWTGTGVWAATGNTVIKNITFIYGDGNFYVHVPSGAPDARR